MHPLTKVYLAEQWMAVISISTYIILSIRILIRYRQWVKNKYSNLKNKSLGWLHIPVLIYSAFWIGWMMIQEIDRFIFDHTLKEFYFLPSFIGLSIITCWIGFKGYIKSQTEVSGFSKASTKTNSRNSNPKEAQKIVSLMNSLKPFLNPELDLSSLSELVNLNPKVTSQIINHDLQTNFYEFVNKHRVEEFKQRVQLADSDKMTLLGHAFESGFNSKSTFNHVFKKFTGKTPREYHLSVKN